MKNLIFSKFLAAAALVAIAGCGETVGEIDKTQPDGVSKALFDGEWYYRSTIVDAPFTSIYTFVGDQGPLERIVFDVQEKQLLAYRSYEHIENAERVGFREDVEISDDSEDGVRFFGDLVASWPIKSHFDVKQGYSASTGEETNVRSENGSDRPWFERDYIRVDWSQPTSDYSAFTLSGIPGSFSWQSDQGEGVDPEDAPQFEDDYMTTVSYAYVDPITIQLGPGVAYPLCFFAPWGFGFVSECNPEVVKVRHSMARVKPTGYRAKSYDDFDMERFGYFRTERLYYDKERGITESGRINLAQRHPIWADEAECYDEDAQFPYANCETQPVIYFMSKDFPVGKPERPHDLIDVNEFIDRYGRAAFARTLDLDTLVDSLGEESLDRIVDLGALANELGRDSIATTDDLSLDNDNVRAVVARVALESLDRYDDKVKTAIADSMIAGLGLADTFGEDGPVVLDSVEDAAFTMMGQWNEALRSAAAAGSGRNLSDIDDVLVLCHNPVIDSDNAACKNPALKPNEVKENGDIRYSLMYWVHIPNQVGLGGFGPSSTDPLSGEILSANAYYYGGNMKRSAAASVDYIAVQAGIRTEDELTGSGRHAQREVRGRSGFGPDEAQAIARSLVDPSVKARLSASLPAATDRSYAQGRLNILKAAPELENMMIFDDIKAMIPDPRLAGLKNVDLTADQRDKMALRNWMHRDADSVRNRHRKTLEHKTMFFADNLDGALEGYAGKYKAAWESIQRALGDDDDRVEIAKATFHEWMKYELTTDFFQAVQGHEVGHTMGLRHNFEASTDALNFDPEFWNLKGENGRPGEAMTTEQEEGAMMEFAYSSIMDYHGRINGDFQGIGRYDRAAIKYAYGEAVEVFDRDPDAGQLDALTAPTPIDVDQPVLATGTDRLEQATRRVHYTAYPNVFGGIEGMYARTDVTLNELKDGDYNEVPYRFCSDDFADSTPTCARSDIGVDPWEIVHNTITRYENYRPFWSSARDSVTFAPFDWSRRIRGGYFQPMVRQYQHFVLDYAKFNRDDFWENQYGTRWEEDPQGGLSGALAASEIMNVFARTIGRPSPSQQYCVNRDTGNFEIVSDDEADYDERTCRRIGADDGAGDMYNDYDYDQYDFRVLRIGDIYDRLAAIEALSDPSTFIGYVDQQADMRRYLINFQTMFPRQTMQLMGGLVMDDATKFGWLIDDDGELTPRKVVGTPAELAAQADMTAVNPYAEYLFPTTKYRIPLIAAYYGMALLNQDFDNSFMDVTRVYLKGNEAEIEPDVEAEDFAEYTDPLNGRQYVAYRVGDGSRAPNVAFDLVTQAAELADDYRSARALRDDYLLSDLQYVTGKLDLLRAMHQVFEFGD